MTTTNATHTMFTVYTVLSEGRYIRESTTPNIKCARDFIRRLAHKLCGGGRWSHTGTGGLLRSHEYMIIAGDCVGDLTCDYDNLAAWDALPRVERWQIGRMDNKTFARRIWDADGVEKAQ